MMIWCVDDTPAIRDIEVYALEASGFQARSFSDGAAMRDALQEGRPDLILLDIMLPGESGLELLQSLRRDPATRRIPVIMATALGAEAEKIRGLDLGADDYLVKPFGMMEMVSRVRAVLRRYEPVEELLQAGPIVMEDGAHLVTVHGRQIDLTRKEYLLLRLFLQQQGKILSRNDLLSQVWGVAYLGESRTVDMHIKTLRQKLGDAGRYIETVIGLGYRLSGAAG